MQFQQSNVAHHSSTAFMAPMIDFLFLMLCFFASIAALQGSPRAGDVQLAVVNDTTHYRDPAQNKRAVIHLTVTKDGSYRWSTPWRDYPMASLEAVLEELTVQQKQGALPQDRTQTAVLLKIDAQAPWKSAWQALMSIRNLGYDAFALYETPHP